MTTESLEIVQKTAKGKKRQATLFKQRELKIKDAGKRKTVVYTIDIVALNAASKKKTALGWRWFIAGIFVIPALILISGIFPALLNNVWYKILFYLLAAGVGAGCFYMAWKTTSIKQIFLSRNSQVPLVELYFNKPSQDEFKRFVGELEQCIHEVQQELDLSLQNQLAGEMKMLRRLNKEGVVSNEVYAKAKEDLLSLYE